MAKRQSSLYTSLKDVPSKAARVSENESENDEHDFSELDSSSISEADEAETTDGFPDCISEAIPTNCTAQCCVNSDKAFQPIDKRTLSTFTIRKQNFQPRWYKQFPRVSICTTYKKAYCLYCQHASKHNLISFSKMGKKPSLKLVSKTGGRL